ncbi:MAG: 16S rRNA (cytosine(967)-C(5))-methyltransferase RsmB [Verrucomicrobia bacterium]|nr:16S rRNA (cytosine(967)-C(5))-methyltransferase RsmB [Verrucomicrobiota bacterium]
MSVEKPREIAVQILLRRHTAHDYVENLLETALEKGSLTGPDRGLVQELVCGVVRWQATLDWLIARKTGGREQKLVLQNLLRLGLYQLFWLDRIPDHAVVNETVELAKQFGCGPQAGFVNALLRMCLREREALRQALADLKTTQPALGCSHPAWLCERWQQRWGDESLRKLVDWNNTPPKLWARVNTLRARMDPLRELWATEGVEVKLHSFDWAGDLLIYELISHRPLGTLASFNHGYLYIQDPSTLLAAHALNPQPGETVLDFCAAPGGKTTLMAQMMQNRGRIVAHDTVSERLALVKENCARLGVTCVETATSDTLESLAGSTLFDRVLVDAPCSNTGVLRRRVDLRWRIRPGEISRLQTIQGEILNQAAKRLKGGGVLVYSTCSLEPEENEAVVKSFLAGQPEFRLQYDRKLLPFVDQVDGAYVARLIRQSN